MDSQNQTAIREDESPIEPVKAKKNLRGVIAALAAFVIVVLLVLPVFSTLQPGYYARYPDLRVRMDHWRGSTHAKMSCVSCHVQPGVAGFASFAVRSIPSFYSQLVEGPKETNLLGIPKTAACQKCHTGYRQVSPNGDLLIPHRAHVEVLHVDCVVCHKNLVHSANTAGFNKPEMTLCLNACHNGTKATNKCTKCHTRKQTPDSHRQADWLEIHSTKTETVNCGKCHSWNPSLNFCQECHKKRPRTHVGNWKKDHQIRAKARGTKGCLFCHGGEKFCKTCH